ncbi:SDR family oxidoreductase [Bacillus sp. AGMB 02131]|uniref:SDR family oxidoreductase n=1 Tax=Peribacillus faecalis TaxID=2772559 RepID=A0A927CUI6_9BACI|nr:SDR family NAD(P)-dependent oxidoreductase [Peribacillus faecalis]MBD3107306.1 SDR family oxidoreductase [Peribacillus faecalis]
MNELFNLTNKIALITGGSRGIGRQIVKTYAAQGATVIIASRNINDCQKVAEEVIQSGGNAMAISCDMANLEDIANMYKQIEDEFGKLDILVNNAGVSITKPSIEVTKEDWDTMFDINIRGLFFSCQEAAKIMIKQEKGKIINVSSIGGIKTFKRIAPYGASKAAVIHLTKSLASEWARYGIFVNGIAPGLISTDINTEEVSDEKLLQKMLRMIPLRHLGQPSDIAAMALYLASDASNFMTGQTISIDGGVTSE